MSNPETPTDERPEHAPNCPGWGAWDIPGACNCGGRYREDGETPTVERFDLTHDGIEPYDDGPWVRYADYLTLHAQLTALQDAVKEWDSATFPAQAKEAADRLRALVDPHQQKETP